MTDQQHQVTSKIVPHAERVVTAARLFGHHFSVRLEPAIFSIAKAVAEDYTGGYWQFYVLSNGGFFMSPEPARPYGMHSPNGFAGTLSAEALGVTACLFAYSWRSFPASAFSDTCAEHYHLLRAFALDHAEAAAILAVCD